MQAINQMRKFATPVDALPTNKEYAFEVDKVLVETFTVLDDIPM